jgi:hypothetical protein
MSFFSVSSVSFQFEPNFLVNFFFLLSIIGKIALIILWFFQPAGKEFKQDAKDVVKTIVKLTRKKI